MSKWATTIAKRKNVFKFNHEAKFYKICLDLANCAERRTPEQNKQEHKTKGKFYETKIRLVPTKPNLFLNLVRHSRG